MVSFQYVSICSQDETIYSSQLLMFLGVMVSFLGLLPKYFLTKKFALWYTLAQ